MNRPVAYPASTIGHLLQAAGDYLSPHTDSPRADAELLLMHALKRNRAYLRTWPELEISQDVAERFWNALERRQHGEPVAYLIQEREFWSRSFRVSPATLIPRPETELLVEVALEFITEHSKPDILDLGTGTGIIAICLAAERPSARVTATDLSAEALEIARFNAGQHNITNISFRQGDWFDALLPVQRFDLIVSNPPYIAADDPHLQQGDLRFEPIHALAAGSDGLEALHIIIEQAENYLKPGGRLMIEHGYNQAERVKTLLLAHNYQNIEQHRDLLGHFRVSSAMSPCSPSTLEPRMTVNPVSLPRALVNQLLHQAQASPDTAIYGLIGEAQGLPTHTYPLAADISLAGSSCLPSAKDLKRLHQQMHERDETLFAAFYSDPTTPSDSPSIQLQAFAGKDCLYIVILLNTRGVLELRGFRQNSEQQIEEVELCLGQE